MSCERYKEVLIDVATGSDPPPLDVREHLDSCPSCRGMFDRERRLLASIDCGIRASANSAVPATLFPAIRATLEHEDKRRNSREPNWMYFAAAAALLLALFPLLRSRRAGESPSQGLAGTATSVASRVDARLQSGEPSATNTPVIRTGTRAHPSTRVALPSYTQRQAEPEVLVPPEERVALSRYIASSSQRKSWVIVARISPAEGATQPLTIDPLNIAALNEQSLEELDRHRDRETQIR